MAYELIIDGSVASPPLFTDGDGTTIVLVSRNPAKSGNQKQTREVWSGSTIAIREMYEDYKDKDLIGSIDIDQNGAKATLNITWTTDFTGGEEPDPDDPENAETWSWQPVEIPTPLVAHPYFQIPYEEGSGELIEDEIARCESKIKRGQSYVATGAYADYTSRYYALRMAGVEEWMQFGIEITKTHTVTVVAAARDAHSLAGKVYQMGAIGAPADVVTAISGMESISSYTTALPSSYQLTPSTFEFVKRPPQCDYSGTGDTAKFDLVETWVGVAEWSAVIYPGGGWDPQGETA